MKVTGSVEDREKSVRPSDFSTDELLYTSHLKDVVFAVLSHNQPWGINSKTVYWLIVDEIASNEVAAGYPVPDPKAIDQLIKLYWNLDAVKKAQFEHAKKLIKFNEKAEVRPMPKNLFAPRSGLTSPKETFMEFGADVVVLREVARLKKRMEESGARFPDENRAAYGGSLEKFPVLTEVTPEITVVNILKEREIISKSMFKKDDLTGLETRWEWIKAADFKQRVTQFEELSKDLMIEFVTESPVSGNKVVINRVRTRRDSHSGTDSRGASEAEAEDTIDSKKTEREKRKRMNISGFQTTGKKKTK